MQVEIWSDFACPFCYIGKRKFEQALNNFPHRDEVQVIFRSFELDPTAKRDIDMKVDEMLARKYGMSREQARAMNDQVTQQAKEVGLDYHLDGIILTNTFDAHRLAHYANDQGKMAQLTERLLKAYFIDSLHLGDHQVLAKLASEAGLDQSETLAMLASDQYSEHVRQDQAKGAELGIRGVPFFVFDSKYAVSGAQPSSAFADVLNKVWEESKGQPVLQVLNQKDETGESADNCADGSCKI